MLSLHFVFLHVNARHDYDLFLKWMRISGELPNESNVVGLRREEHLKFCKKERNFNFFWYRVVSCFTLGLCLMFCIPLLLLPFETSWCSYILVQAFNIFHLTFSIFYFLHSVYTTNIFVLQTIHLFSLKFKFIGRHLASLGATKKINNGRVARLIFEFNRIQLELLEVNTFFKNFLGWFYLNLFLCNPSFTEFLLRS